MRRLLAGFGMMGIAILLWSVLATGEAGVGSDAGDHGKHHAKLSWKRLLANTQNNPKVHHLPDRRLR